MVRLKLKKLDTSEKVAAIIFVLLVSLPIIIVSIIVPLYRQWSLHRITITAGDYKRFETLDGMFSAEIPSSLKVTHTQTSQNLPAMSFKSATSVLFTEFHTQDFIVFGDVNILSLGLIYVKMPKGALDAARRNRDDMAVRDSFANAFTVVTQDRILERQVVTRPCGKARRLIGKHIVLEIYSFDDNIVSLVVLGTPKVPTDNLIVEHFFDSFHVTKR